MTSLSQIPIVDVWRRLGGPDPRRCGNEYRSRAFWRDGNSLSVAIDADKNCYFDFRDSSGGGVLKLVELILGCGRHGSLEWLRDEFGLEDSRAAVTPEQWKEIKFAQSESERLEAALQPSYETFLRELVARRDELIRMLRELDDNDLELELRFTYARIAVMRDAADDVDDDAVEVTIAIVKFLSEAAARDEKKAS